MPMTYLMMKIVINELSFVVICGLKIPVILIYDNRVHITEIIW